MSTEEFFAEQSEESEVKTRIVEKYFDAWARVMVPTLKRRGDNKLAYLDTHSGRGRYDDGSPSTPLLILQKALESADLCSMLVTVFNDIDPENCRKLEAEITRVPNIQRLRHKPVVMNKEIEQDAATYFTQIRRVPTFSFVDPWGYKSISREIVKALVSEWGCDCVFFFNYRRVNAAFSNPLFRNHIDALFGAKRAERVSGELSGLRPDQREARILEELAQALKELATKLYVLPFVFKDEGGRRTTHCLVFVSKHELGLEIMKDIMAAESSVLDQGVPTFTYSPADERTPLLFSLARPLEALEDMLLERYAGQTLTMEQVYRGHHTEYRYVKKNYKAALLALEQRGKIAVHSAKRRRAGTFGPDLQVKFPPRQ